MFQDRKPNILTSEQQKLVVDHEGLVFKIAIPLARRTHQLDDVLAEGRLGLCIAAGRFEPERGLAFTTYAAHWVRAMILEYIMRGQSQVRFGSRRVERKIYFQIGRARRAAGDDLDAVAAYLGVDRKTLDESLPRVERTDVCIDSEHTSLRVVDGRQGAEEKLLAGESAQLLKKAIRGAIRRLEPRERIIAESRLLPESKKTLRVLGAEFGLSRERVRQIEKKVKQKLRIALADVAA